MEAVQRGFEAALEQLGLWGPRILVGLIILLIGWVLAKLLQRLVSGLAVRLGFDRPFTRMASEGDMPSVPASSMPSRVLGVVVFWLVMLFTILAFLTQIRLDQVALPIQSLLVRIGEWLPNLFAASVLALAGWLVASVAAAALTKLLKAARVDARLAGWGVLPEEAARQGRFSAIAGVIVYAFVLLLFIIPAMDVLGLGIIAITIQNAVQMIANAVPGIIAAILVMAVAALIAYVVRTPITRLLAATGVDRWGKYIGLDPARGGATVSSVAGHLLFWLILLFAFPAALDRMGLEPIVAPLRDTWSNVIGVLPRLGAAIGIAILAVLLARIVGPLVERVLSGAGFDGILGNIGLARLQSASEAEGGRWLPSKIVGVAVAMVIYLLLAQEALRALGLVYLAELVNRIILYLPNLVVAVAILTIALYMATFLGRLVRAATSAVTEINSELAAGATYVAIVIFGTALAIAQLRIGGDLVQWTVLLVVAALCLAAAIALGLGFKPLIERWAQTRFSRWVDRQDG